MKTLILSPVQALPARRGGSSKLSADAPCSRSRSRRKQRFRLLVRDLRHARGALAGAHPRSPDRDAYADDVHYASEAIARPSGTPHQGQRKLAPGGAMAPPSSDYEATRYRPARGNTSWWGCCNDPWGLLG